MSKRSDRKAKQTTHGNAIMHTYMYTSFPILRHPIDICSVAMYINYQYHLRTMEVGERFERFACEHRICMCPGSKPKGGRPREQAAENL